MVEELMKVIVFVVIGVGFVALIYGFFMWLRERELPHDEFESGDRGIAGAMLRGAKRSYMESQSKNQLEASITRYQALEKLKSLLDSGAITDDEFRAEKQELLRGKAA